MKDQSETRADEPSSGSAVPTSAPWGGTPGGSVSRFVVIMAMSWLVAFALGWWLLSSAGVWNVLANSRVLAFLIDVGVIAYTDADLGIIEGVPDHELWLRSQDPILLPLFLFGVALYIAYWFVESWRFRESLRLAGATVEPHQAERAFLAGTHYGRWFPLRFRDAAIEEALDGRPTTPTGACAATCTSRSRGMA